LENFDVAGGWRDRYRALEDADAAKPEAAKPDTAKPLQPKAEGIGKGGHFFDFHYARPVDAAGTLPDGRSFADLRDLKRLLLSDERQIARNLASQLITYSTGAPVRFGDRPQLEAILDRTKANDYRVAAVIEAIVQSDLFRSK